MAGSTSQDQRILNLLAASWPEWTPAPVLAKISLQYCARISELRERGWEIANRVEMKDSVRHGFYRLGSAPTPRSNELRATRPPVETKPMEPGNLFDDPQCLHLDLG